MIKYRYIYQGRSDYLELGTDKKWMFYNPFNKLGYRITDICNDLGAEGWEYVGMMSEKQTDPTGFSEKMLDITYYVFKQITY